MMVMIITNSLLNGYIYARHYANTLYELTPLMLTKPSKIGTIIIILTVDEKI